MAFTASEMAASPAALTRLANSLSRATDSTLANWRAQVALSSEVSLIKTLSRNEFYDHIPPFLARFCSLLRGDTGKEGEPARQHGAHRWQQGLDFEEVVHEWNLLQRVLIDQIDTLRESAGLNAASLHSAHRLLADTVQKAILASLGEFHVRQRREAEARVHDLHALLERRDDRDERRGRGLHQVSHDLRGTLQSIHLSCHSLKQTQLEPEARMHVERLSQASDDLSQMLSDMLDLARLEAGLEQCAASDFDAAVLLSDMCETMQPTAQAEGLTLRARGSDTLPVRNDATKLRRIAQNLVLNALNHTQMGSVEIGWQSEPHRRWSFHVADTGPGLPTWSTKPLAEALEDAEKGAEYTGSDFKHDGESDACLSDGSGGAEAHGEGVGLAIVHRLCELLGGVLEIESVPGRGTTFRVLMPMP